MSTATILLSIIVYLVGIFIAYCLISKGLNHIAEERYVLRSEQENFVEEKMKKPRTIIVLSLSWIMVTYILIACIGYAIYKSYVTYKN